jgi:hypothetical protein
MTTSRRILAALPPVAVAAAGGAAVALGGGHGGPPKPALVTSHRLHAASVVGSYCSSSGNDEGRGVAGCGDSAYPLRPKAVLPITPSSKLRVNLRKRTTKVNADLIEVDGDKFKVVGPKLTAKPVRGSHRHVWRLHLPSDLRDADAIGTWADFSDGGDADFWVGVKPVERWP